MENMRSGIVLNYAVCLNCRSLTSTSLSLFTAFEREESFDLPLGIADTSSCDLKVGYRQVHKVIVPGALNLVKTPFFAHFDAKFGSSVGGIVSELPTILPKLSRSEINAPGMLVSERSQTDFR